MFPSPLLRGYRELVHGAAVLAHGRGLSSMEWLDQIEAERGPLYDAACALPARELDAIVHVVWVGRMGKRGRE